MVIGRDKSCRYLQKRRRLLQINFLGGSYKTQIRLALPKIKTIAIQLAQWQTCNGFYVFNKTLVDNLYVFFK